MQNVTEQIDFLALDRLFSPEVVGHETDPVLKVRGHIDVGVVAHIFQILNDEFQVRILLRHRHTGMAHVPAHVDHCAAFRQLAPVEARDEMSHVVIVAGHDLVHHAREAGSIFFAAEDVVKVDLWGIVGQVPCRF